MYVQQFLSSWHTASPRECRQSPTTRSESKRRNQTTWISPSFKRISQKITRVFQDEIQNAHWQQSQVSLFTAALYHLPPNTKPVSIWSNGPSSQFKNQFIIAALKFLQHKLQITWNCFATSHGKGPVDGIGGAVKRQEWTSVKARKLIVCDAKSFVIASKASCNV